MAIPSRQIGWSTRDNLLWQISKQLEHLICVKSGGCGTTTTTTTIVGSCVEISFEVTTNCGDQDYATVEYTDCNGVLQTANVPAGSESLKVCTLVGATPPIFICGDGNILTGSACSITTTTTTTTEVLINTNYTFVNCPGPCGESECAPPYNYFNIWMTETCIDSWMALSQPTIGCKVWLDSEGTIPFPSGAYNNGEGGCVYIENGIIIPAP